ncbi:hypothetical protein LWI29_025057 [Acer saccharum]|uniref:Uncharacterized protein n=1 Tax=Acer saccharum TaxID=4024 RepID=A0AA39TCU2_ACESA|nr:hypothetical protein LWI29_025057 [Acer saccharum]
MNKAKFNNPAKTPSDQGNKVGDIFPYASLEEYAAKSRGNKGNNDEDIDNEDVDNETGDGDHEDEVEDDNLTTFSCKEITLQSGEEFGNEEEKKSEAKEEDEGHENFSGSLATQNLMQGCTKALLIVPNPKCFPSYDETTSRAIETVHMVEEIPPFQVKREMNEKSSKEKITFIDKIRNEEKANTFEVNDFSKVPKPD